MDQDEHERQEALFEIVSKLKRMENCELMLSNDGWFWICPMDTSSLSDKPYWLLVYRKDGSQAVAKWEGTEVDEFWFIKHGFPMQVSVEIARLLVDALFAQQRASEGRKAIEQTKTSP